MRKNSLTFNVENIVDKLSEINVSLEIFLCDTVDFRIVFKLLQQYILLIVFRTHFRDKLVQKQLLCMINLLLHRKVKSFFLSQKIIFMLVFGFDNGRQNVKWRGF